MRKTFSILVSLLLFAGFTFAQTNGDGDMVKNEKSRGADPHIKVDMRTNGDGQISNAIQPKEKGGKPARGAGDCLCGFINYTDWYINCYVNGTLEGYVAPYGDGGVTVAGGNTEIYVVVRFEDESTLSWGPVEQECNNQSFIMEVFEDMYYWELDNE